MAMVTDPYIDAQIQPIINYYNQMELELIIDIAKRFANYDEVSGSLEWHLKKLDELGGLTQSALKIIARYSGKAESELAKMLKKAGFYNIDANLFKEAFSKGVITVDPVKMLESPTIAATIEQSYIDTKQAYKLIQTKAIEATQQAYMDVLNTAYLNTSSGFYDYQTSIKKAIQRMASKGITGATYNRGGTIVRYSIEGTVRRDTLTAVHQLANRVALQGCKETGVDYVEVSKHIGARISLKNPIANHYGWQGGIYKIDGQDDKYRNLKEATGYPDDIQGLGGVNCRHRIFPFFIGISIPNPIHYDEEENKRVYELNQKQRKMERDIRNLKKKYAAAKAINDTDTMKFIDAKLKVKYQQINDFCKVNGLKRDYSRELIAEQI